MTIAVPTLSAGIFIPNPTLSIPERDGSGNPAGWYFDTGVATTATGYYGHSLFPWHARVQQFVLSALGNSFWNSPLVEPGVLVADVDTLVRGTIYGQIEGSTSSSNFIRLIIYGYDAAGTVVYSRTLVTLSGSAAASAGFVLSSAEVTAHLTATTVRVGFALQLTRASGNPIYRVAFLGSGVWDDTVAGHFDLSRVPSFGSFADRVDPDAGYRTDQVGIRRRVQTARFRKAHRLHWIYTGMPQSDAANLWRLWNLNGGQDDDLATVNPTGAPQPCLIECNNPAFPAVCYADFDDSPSLAPVNFHQDPPDWGGSWTMTERLL